MGLMVPQAGRLCYPRSALRRPAWPLFLANLLALGPWPLSMPPALQQAHYGSDFLPPDGACHSHALQPAAGYVDVCTSLVAWA